MTERKFHFDVTQKSSGWCSGEARYLYQENSGFEPRPGYQHTNWGLFMVAFSRFTAIMGHDLEIAQTSSTSLIFDVPDNVSNPINDRVT